ncbi:MAG TPA: NADP-dependent isocitrate dehydrogenase, partial [Flavobacterium sp.]
DIFKEGISKEKVGTQEFAAAVIANLGNKPALLKEVSYAKDVTLNLPKYVKKPSANKVLVGVDVFVHWSGTDPDTLAEKIQLLTTGNLQLSMITNRGIKVWPEGFSETFCTDHWRCRFKPVNGNEVTKEHIIEILSAAMTHDIDTIKTENLYEFDGKPGFSLGQGQ